ncbi:hypothetical protein FRC17_002482 [Serendipita sp. 399]|nr:hypothetical protein FRC17_002482 [Serendipita sp. 399]
MNTRQSSSSLSAEDNDGLSSAPRSPPPDEARGRTRTRRPMATLEPSGYHTFESMGRRFTVESRWKLVRQMGVGAFGAVVSAQDSISGEHVAIKQINRAYDKPQLARRVLREITLLRHFQAHPNVADLHQIIRSGQDLSTDHIAYFVYQILGAIKFIHGCNVIHRDLKSANILVNSTCEIRICDFGLARGYEKYLEDGSERISPLTEYVATRWYRAPEIMLGFEGYDRAIDIWSVGCIFGELLNGKPIFQGKDYVDQLKCIFEYLGSPSEDILGRIARERARKYVASLPKFKKKPFNFQRDDEEAMDLLYSMLCYEPELRITAAEAMEHPWLAAFYDPEDELLATPAHSFTRWRTIESLETIKQFRDAIWDEIQEYRSQVRSLALDHSQSPVAQLHSHVPILKEPIPEEIEPDESETKVEVSPVRRDPKFTIEPEEAISQPEPPHQLFQIQQEAGPTAIPRPRKNSQYQDPFATFGRRSSAIFGGTYSPAPTPSRASSFTQFPVLDEGESATPSVAVPVRSRLPSMIDGSQYRHLRTLSTVSIHENAARPGGLAAIAPIGKYVGAEKTTGVDGPPSTPPVELRNE